jgi:phenylalanyl-tRNA synthetase beta subunit
VADEGIAYGDIVKAIGSKGIQEISRLPRSTSTTGEKLPAGKKGITIRIIYQSESRTLEDAMINKWQDKIIQSLQGDLGITLRQ